MEKIDLFKQNKEEYQTSKNPVKVNIGETNYLSISGMGEPGGKNYLESVEALYAVAYTVKMTRKKNQKGDYVICKLECFYPFEEGQNIDNVPREQWPWELLIRTPEFVEQQDITDAIEVLLGKDKTPYVKKVALKAFEYGPCIQLMHIGPYEDEHLSFKKMLDYAKENNFTPLSTAGEVYISDPRRVPPEKLKTILRLPVKE